MAITKVSFSQKTIQLMSGDGVYHVPFVLKSKSDTASFTSNQEGTLNLGNNTLKKYGSTLFSIEFSNPLDALIYSNKVYFKKGLERKDPHLSFESFTISLNCPNETTVFFLRQKENSIDDTN